MKCLPGMPATKKPTKEDVEQASSRLAEGLKSCRSVVNDYRVILTGDQPLPIDPSEKAPPEK